MKKAIIKNAKEDSEQYLSDFNKFWEASFENIDDEGVYSIYLSTLIFKNYKLSFEKIGLTSFDVIVDEIFEDINSSFFLAMMGLYRSAHMHLRSSIELTLQLLYFIHHPIEYGKWKNNNFIIKHEVLARYVIEHPNFNVDIEVLIGNITAQWKRFSKHIHGESPVFFQCEKDVRKTSEFSVKDYGAWKTNFLKCTYNLNLLLLLFFQNEINDFPQKNKKILLSILKDEDKNYFE